MKKMTPEELEEFIHRELRGLPVRPAPSTLEARVLAAIEHRARIAWYHKSWSYWPAAVRALFLAAITGLAGAAISAFYLFMQGGQPELIGQLIVARFSVVTQTYGAILWTVHFLGRMLNTLSPLWLCTGGVLIAVMYALCFGLGATAYRMSSRKN